MSAAVMFQQVSLEKPSKDGVFTDTIWIEAKFAKEGEYIKRKLNGEWSDGWKVIKASPGLRTQEQVLANRDLHKDHRKGTDI
jgi:hypothetical protein